MRIYASAGFAFYLSAELSVVQVQSQRNCRSTLLFRARMPRPRIQSVCAHIYMNSVFPVATSFLETCRFESTSSSGPISRPARSTCTSGRCGASTARNRVRGTHFGLAFDPGVSVHSLDRLQTNNLARYVRSARPLTSLGKPDDAAPCTLNTEHEDTEPAI
ncbi:hypothetical protein B0H15DRAFT_42507 [Mycena belliarum]|uniref:Uncharacterized protein n=1 Tax=Mycena belliarum TaxID=1033014 RepID=A0AAD6TR34_9AGAR|nr:hypothetical protein B0H15DRAFT_42507 [Mycena belliae]